MSRSHAEILDPLEAIRAIDAPAWLVGGSVRDRLLGRPTSDYDVTVAGEPQAVARRLAQLVSGPIFRLSEGFGGWRVIAPDRSWNVDVLPLAGASIEEDLARRDLTINAIAQQLPDGDLIDPFGGAGDLQDRRLRMVSAEAFAQDPLRSLRLIRIACELGFSIEAGTAAAAARNAPGLARVAPERQFAEFKRIISSERALSGMELIDELSVMPVLLPELAALRGVGQSPYHHLDVYEHTLAVLAETIELERAPDRFLGSEARAVSEFLAQPLANELTRWQALRFGALLHDIAKPQTREVNAQGRITFMGHDAAGGRTAAAILIRLRASERLAEHIAALARHHLRLGFLVHEMPLTRRAVYRYLRECDPVQVDVTVLSVADRLATRGARSDEAIRKHLRLADQLLVEALAWVANPPRPPVRGDELARALGIEPGPELGSILQELEEASFAEEIDSDEQAVTRAREILRERSGGARA
ncbi:MAG TPA: HDIG domain-containing protein [Solirubrobacteraceae bacterium]|jgi:putative nucleotidyltransferase with HDIG domain